MDFEELLELLEIDSPDEFNDFEHFTELIEINEEIPYKMFFNVLVGVEPDLLADLTDNFFEDILKGVPDEEIEIYTLLSSIRQELIGLAKLSTNKEEKAVYIDELFRFKSWYLFDSIVYCTRISDNVKKELPINEALTLNRLEAFGEEKYRYDFSPSMDYEIDEYSIPLDASIDEEYEEILEEDDDFYEEGLIHRDFPVVEGESLEDEEDDDLEGMDY